MLHGDPGFDEVEGLHKSGNLIWDADNLEWVKATGTSTGQATLTASGTLSITPSGITSITAGPLSVAQAGAWILNVIPAGSFTVSTQTVTHGVSTITPAGVTSVTHGSVLSQQFGAWILNVVPAGSFTNSTQTITPSGIISVTPGGITSITAGPAMPSSQHGTWTVNAVPAGSFTQGTQTITTGTITTRPQNQDSWIAYFTPGTNAGGRIVGDLFNHSTDVLNILGIWMIPTNTAIVGNQIAWDVCRTSAQGVGTTSITPRPMDTAQTALSSGVTARASTTGGATVVYTYFQIYSFNEETNAASVLLAYYNQLPVMPSLSRMMVLRQDQGMMVKQTVTMTSGLTGMMVFFSRES